MTTQNALSVVAERGVPYVDAVREFDASVANVYRAYTEPELVAQWLGPRELEMEMDHYDVRPGGSYAFTHRNADGDAFGFRGVFHNAEANTEILQTFEFLGMPGHVSLERVTFEDLGGRTRIRIHAVYQSVQDRDGMVASGMERGMREGYERLDELLAATVPSAG